MVEHYGSDRTDAILSEMGPLLEQTMGVPVGWKKQSWKEAGDHVRDSRKHRHPHLSDGPTGSSSRILRIPAQTI